MDELCDYSTIWENVHRFEQLTPTIRSLFVHKLYNYGNDYGFDSITSPNLKRETTSALLFQIFQETEEHPEFILITKFLKNVNGIKEVIPLLLQQISYYSELLLTTKTSEMVQFTTIAFGLFRKIIGGVFVEEINYSELEFIPKQFNEQLKKCYFLCLDNPTQLYSYLVDEILFLFLNVFYFKAKSMTNNISSYVESLFYDKFTYHIQNEEVIFFIKHQIGLSQILFRFLKNDKLLQSLTTTYLSLFEFFLQILPVVNVENIDLYLSVIPSFSQCNIIVLKMEKILEKIPVNKENQKFFISIFNMFLNCCRFNAFTIDTKKELLSSLLSSSSIKQFKHFHEYHILINQLSTNNEGIVFDKIENVLDYRKTIYCMFENELDLVTPGSVINMCIFLETDPLINEQIPLLIHCISYFIQKDLSLSLFCAKQLRSLICERIKLNDESVSCLIQLINPCIDKQVIFIIIDILVVLAKYKQTKKFIKQQIQRIKTMVLSFSISIQSEIIGKLFTLLCDQCIVSNKTLQPSDHIGISKNSLIVTFASVYPLILSLTIQNTTTYLRSALIDFVSFNSYNCSKFCKYCFDDLMKLISKTPKGETKEFLVCLASIAVTPSCSIQQMKNLMRDTVSEQSFSSDSFSILKNVLQETSRLDFKSFFFKKNSFITSQCPISFNYKSSSIVLWFCPQSIINEAQTLAMFQSPEHHLMTISITNQNYLQLRLENSKIEYITIDIKLNEMEWYCAVFVFQQKNNEMICEANLIQTTNVQVKTISIPIQPHDQSILFCEECFGCSKVKNQYSNYFVGYISSCVIFPLSLTQMDISQIDLNINTYLSQPELFMANLKKLFVLSTNPIETHQNIVGDITPTFKYEHCKIITSTSNINSFQQSGSFKFIFSLFELLSIHPEQLSSINPISNINSNSNPQSQSQIPLLLTSSDKVENSNIINKQSNNSCKPWTNLSNPNDEQQKKLIGNNLTVNIPTQKKSVIGNNRTLIKKKQHQSFKKSQETIVLDAILSILLNCVKIPKMHNGFILLNIANYLHYILIALPSECITKKCFDEILQLADIFNGSSIRSSFESIFLDYRIWSGCEKEIQILIIEQIKSLKEPINLLKFIVMIELFMQPHQITKSIQFISLNQKLPLNEIEEVYITTITGFFQIASRKITIENITAINHYLYMIHDDDVIRNTLDLLFIHFHTFQKEYNPFAEIIVNNCINIQSIIPFKQQYKILLIMLLFLETVIQTNPMFDCNTITLLILSCIFVSKNYDSNLYYLLIAQSVKIQLLLDVPKINLFAMRYSEDTIKEQICETLYNNTLYDNFPQSAFNLIESPIVIMNTIQITKDIKQRDKLFNLLKVYIIKKMTYLNKKAQEKIEEFINIMITSAFYYTEEMIMENDEEAFKLLLFVFEQLDIQIRPKISKLKQKSNKDKQNIINCCQLFLLNVYHMTYKFKNYLTQCNFILSSNLMNESKSCFSLLLVFVKDILQIPNCFNFINENNTFIELNFLELLLTTTLLEINLINEQDDITNLILVILSYAENEKYSQLISLEFFTSLMLLKQNQKLFNSILRIPSKLNKNYKNKLMIIAKELTEILNITSNDSLFIISLLSGTLSSIEQLQQLQTTQFIKRMKDLILKDGNGINSYQTQQEMSMSSITDCIKKFSKNVLQLNDTIVKDFEKQLNQIQPIVEENKQITKGIIEELNENLFELTKQWKKFTEGKNEFRNEMTKNYWKLTNEVSNEGFKMFWKINNHFDDHKTAKIYSAERSQLEDENNEEINNIGGFIENCIECEWITLKAFKVIKKFQGRITIRGKLEIKEKELIFIDDPFAPNSEFKRTKEKRYIFQLNEVKEIIIKRYFTEFNAIEIFFNNSSQYFLFNNESITKKIYNKLLILCNLPDESIELKLQKITEKWSNGKLSNFEYLLKLNQYASRSYHDLSHYPIFPWIIQDYTSISLDLSNPTIYRPLELPIPCINPKRHSEEMKRFEELFGKNGVIKDQVAYIYPTFYSACDYVFHFLVRVEPFTTMFIRMNENHYDRPERMFYSIGHTWDICMNSTQCNIELIPEFFYLPDFLINENSFEFGINPVTQTMVDNVTLPPWAKNAYEFVNINRSALESPYVSLNINKWIDLIFGYKSCGEEARKADNLYHPSCYIENFIKGGEDEELLKKRAMFSGQLPVQLFTKPHPTRKLAIPLMVDLCTKRCYCKSLIIPESPCISSCLDDKGIVMITKNTIYRTLYSMEYCHKKGTIKNRIFDQKLLSRNKRFAISKCCGVIQINSELKQYTLKSNEVTSILLFEYLNNDYLAFGCSDSLVGICCLNQPQEVPIYLNVHLNKITSLFFDNNSHMLFIGDDSGLVSCYSANNWKYIWHIKLLNNTTVLSIITYEQYIYVSTPSILYAISFKGKIITKLDFYAQILVNSFIPGTIAALTNNNVLCFISTSLLSCLPIDVNMPDISKEEVISLHYHPNAIYIVLKNGTLSRISMSLFDN
ncbi:BEACH domain containing protein [Entamoeba histolytica]